MNSAVLVICFVSAMVINMALGTEESCFNNDKISECMQSMDYAFIVDNFYYDPSDSAMATAGDLENYQDDICDIFLGSINCGALVSQECEDFVRSELEGVTFKDAQELSFTPDQC